MNASKDRAQLHSAEPMLEAKRCVWVLAVAGVNDHPDVDVQRERHDEFVNEINLVVHDHCQADQQAGADLCIMPRTSVR